MAAVVCAPGEYSIVNETACWPCEANHFCQDGLRHACGVGHWAPPRSEACRPCPPGMECGPAGGVVPCGFGTYSPGNRSACSACTECGDRRTARRCNATHDSACDALAAPTAVITVFQEFRTGVPGELFGLFVMIYAAALPRARVTRVCGGARCVDCFQGVCPDTRSLRGPAYSTRLEIRFDAGALEPNLKTLADSAYLLETAKDTMARLTDAPFVSYSRVEHRVVCPDGVWDGARCQPTSRAMRPPDDARSWVGLCVGIAILLVMVMSGGQRPRWTPVPVTEAPPRED